MSDTQNKSQQNKQDTQSLFGNLKIEDKDVRPLLAGIAMLILASIVGYSLGFQSGRAVVPSSSQTFVEKDENMLTPSVDLIKETKEKKEVAISPIPSNWSLYDSFFGVAQFTFRYPPDYTVSDTNVRTGQIYVFPQDNFSFPAPLLLDTLNRTFYFQDYQSGSVKDWFLDNIQIVYPDTDFSQLMIKEVTPREKMSYLKIENWPENIKQINANLFNGTWYVYADTTISYYIVDNGVMKDEDVLRILSSLYVDTSSE